MTTNNFPALQQTELQASLATLRSYALILGKIRRALSPRQKHWSHVSLRATATGLTTTPIPGGQITFELLMDLASHKIALTTSHGEHWHKPLRGQSAKTFFDEVLTALAAIGIHPEFDPGFSVGDDEGDYDAASVGQYWQAFSQIDAIFKHFRAGLRQETSPVQFWPHHVDLAMLWFSGRLVPGVDPDDEESAAEQMNFGFAPGDEGVPEPYFYITAYPLPDGLVDTPLPDNARWHTEGFTGAVLPYQALVTADEPAEKLLDFLRTAQQAGAKLMLNS